MAFSPSPPTWPAGLRAAAIVAISLVSVAARAGVEWHPDLDTAHAASRISRRPVLAVFVADWGSRTTSLEATCLGSPEAEAVLATCFEPVRIDIEEQPELSRAAGVSHVPSACVLGADNSPLASFEMPGSPAAFVSAAILAAQRAGTVDSTVAGADDPRSMPRTRTAPEPTAVTAAAFGSTIDTAATGSSRPPRGSMARVAAKVKNLADFATNESLPDAAGAPVELTQASRPVTEPEPDYTPLSWPAEQATAPPTAAALAPTIEPATTTPAPVPPWLQAPPARTAPAAAPPAPAVTSTPEAAPPVSQPLPPTARPEDRAEAKPEPRQPAWLSTLQRPFAALGKPAVEPPTMPPAPPRNPFAAAAPATPAAAAAENAAPAPDPYGSMPLGLEGFCPVTLVDRGTWTEGRAQWGVRHRGRTYLFAGPEEQQTFLANPDRYAPALSGDDPVLALDRGTSTPGQRRYGVTYQSRMYLFATPETRAAFAAAPDRYAPRIVVAERAPAAAAATRTY